MSNDTFELTSIHGIPIFASEVWRDASNGEKSIADWVYEKNKPVSPICYFKEFPNIAWLTFNGITSKNPDDPDLKRSLFEKEKGKNRHWNCEMSGFHDLLRLICIKRYDLKFQYGVLPSDQNMMVPQLACVDC